MSVRSQASHKAVARAFAVSTVVHCEYCGKRVFTDAALADPWRAVGDHRLPRSRGGPNSMENIAVVCYACDSAKGPLTDVEYLAIRHDARALREAVALWNHRLSDDPVHGLYASRGERQAAKVARRSRALAERITIPDPGCEWCAGTGKVRVNARTHRHCRCSVTDAVVAHLRGEGA